MKDYMHVPTFSELVLKLLQYAGREMYARKKDELVGEDSFAAIVMAC